MDEEQMQLFFYGSFDPDTNYTLTVSPDLTDLWGSRLGQPFSLHFRTAPLDPSVQFPYSSDASLPHHPGYGYSCPGHQHIGLTPFPWARCRSMTWCKCMAIMAMNIRQNFIPQRC